MNATTPTANKAAIPPTISAVRRDIENAADSVRVACSWPVPSRNGVRCELRVIARTAVSEGCCEFAARIEPLKWLFRHCLD